MTNFEWIKSMGVKELAKVIINTCDNFDCGICPLKNSEGRCVVNSKYDGDDATAIEWLESECEEDEKDKD